VKTELLYSACIAGAISEAEYLAGLREAGLVDLEVPNRLVYDALQLRGLLDPSAGAACCSGSSGLTALQLEDVCTALAGKVASLRFVGRKR